MHDPHPAPQRALAPVRGMQQGWHWLRRGCWVGLVSLVGACSQAPVGIGYLGGLTGAAADLGVGGRDGALFAVEQANGAGGIHGRAVVLHTFDDGQQAPRLKALWPAVVQSGIQALVGPMTSSMAAEWLPLANAAQLLTVSPTVTSSLFSGQDDHFFRVISSTREYAAVSARHHLASGHGRRYALILDASNRAYTVSWAGHFTAALGQHGASVVAQVAYDRQSGEPLSAVLTQALEAKPDALMVVANAADTAQLAQLLRKRNLKLPLLGVEWAATPQLLLAGGRAVEGMLLTQYFDRESQAPTYLRFAAAFEARFGRAPGFVEVAAFDATQVVLSALREQQAGETLKHTVLRLQRFQGVQQSIVFDAFGDSQRELMITRVQAGRFAVEAP